MKVTDESKTKTEKQSMTIQGAQQSFEASKKKLGELRDEKTRLELELAGAAKKADPATIIICRRGLEDLHDDLFAAEIAAMQAELELCKLKREATKPAIEAAEKELEKAVKVRQEFQADERRIKGLAHEIWTDQRNLERRIGALEREISTRIWAGLQNNEKPGRSMSGG